uniref:PCI domain-containing protein n=1 Tax=Phaeocystis cordata TaxID=118079 RepID=A0A7S1HS12_9EUKA
MAETSAAAARSLDHFLSVGKTVQSNEAAKDLIRAATAEPGILAFQEISELPAVRALEASDDPECRGMFKLLQCFAYGTFSTYREQREREGLPSISAAHELKLRQLTVVTLADGLKVLPYSLLMRELALNDVRELEDFLINECIYTGALSGKLDQRQGLFEVEYAAGRDIRPEKVDDIIAALEDWLGASDALLGTIQGQMGWAEQQVLAKKAHAREVREKVDKVKKNIRTELELRGQQDAMMTEPGLGGSGAMDEDRMHGSTRSKRRR